jgi:signal transduction histidine kinase
LPIEHSGAPIVEADGTSAGLVFVFRDVSQRRKTEEALRSSEKLALIGRLSATIAHEIRNPLDAVSNVLYLIKSAPGSTPQTRENVAMGEQEVMRMGQIAGQLLNYSRESRTPVSVSIPDILQGTVALFMPKIRAQQIDMHTDYSSKHLVQAIPGELRQVFSNILANALEAVGRNGKICLRSRDAVDWRSGRRGVKVLFSDNGPGIKAEARGRLFTPFFSTKGEQGTGLGLWLTRSLVDKNNGRITFRSNSQPQNRGTTFAIFFPRFESSKSPELVGQDQGEK